MQAKHTFEQYATTFDVKIQRYHAKNGALNTGSVAQVLSIKTGYISPQFHIVFDNNLKQHPQGLKKNLRQLGRSFQQPS